MLHHVPALLRSDLPFDQEDAHRYLPWVIAVMTALAVFMIAAGMSLGHVFLGSTSEFEYRVQVQIPFAEGKEKQVAERLAGTLRTMKGVERAAQVDERAMAELLDPWIGSSGALEELPVPQVVDVWMKPDAYRAGTISAKKIRTALREIAPEAVVDDYREWADNFHAVMRTARRVAYFIGGLVMLAVTTVVLLISRASVQLHFPIVTLLHRMGAQDAYISRQFQINAGWMTLKGSLVGSFLAAALYALIGGVIERLDLPLLPEGILFSMHAVMFVLFPLLMSGLVGMATYFSVLAMIRRLY
jgi:cell division transport system permease protein